jgi:LysM repeat protein
LGRHSKPPPIRLPNAVPTAAAPTLASVVAAFFMSQQAPAVAEAIPAVPRHSAALDAALQPVMSPAQLVSARQARAEATVPQQPSSSIPNRYTVQPGDSLFSIAGRLYHNAAAWPVLYWGNHGQIRWADIIKAGQVLQVPAKHARIPAAPAQLGPPPPPQVHTVAAYTPRHASPAPAAAQPAPVPPAPVPPAPVQAPGPADAVPASTLSGGWPGGAFGNCVVQRESGGNPNVWNASGHWGLYQFSASTWAEYGGSPADFGSAGVAGQEQVFMNALAQGGQFNWAPYDGC